MAEVDPNLDIEVGAYRGLVVVRFKHAVEWLGLPPKETRELATTLLTNAAEAEQQLEQEEKQNGPPGSE